MMLERAGYKVISAIGAERGIALCKESNYDLLILGHSIPQDEKQKLLAEFRKHCPAPIIVLRRNPGEQLIPNVDYQVETDPDALITLIEKIFNNRSAAEA